MRNGCADRVTLVSFDTCRSTDNCGRSDFDEESARVHAAGAGVGVFHRLHRLVDARRPERKISGLGTIRCDGAIPPQLACIRTKPSLVSMPEAVRNHTDTAPAACVHGPASVARNFRGRPSHHVSWAAAGPPCRWCRPAAAQSRPEDQPFGSSSGRSGRSGTAAEWGGVAAVSISTGRRPKASATTRLRPSWQDIFPASSSIKNRLPTPVASAS